jgi:hypothetical protein
MPASCFAVLNDDPKPSGVQPSRPFLDCGDVRLGKAGDWLHQKSKFKLR